jgi:hypothetical protein
VDGAGDQLLARARLALDEHRRVGARGVRHQLVDAHHLRAVADETGAGKFRLALVGHALRALGGALDDRHHLLDVEGLGDEVGRPLLNRLHRNFERALGGQRDDLRLGVEPAELAYDLKAANVRHEDVGENNVEMLPAPALDGLAPAPDSRHVVAAQA